MLDCWSAQSQSFRWTHVAKPFQEWRAPLEASESLALFLSKMLKASLTTASVRHDFLQLALGFLTLDAPLKALSGFRDALHASVKQYWQGIYRTMRQSNCHSPPSIRRAHVTQASPPSLSFGQKNLCQQCSAEVGSWHKRLHG